MISVHYNVPVKYTNTTHHVLEAVQFIEQGRVVAFPTGTSYGLAVDALQGHALQRLRNMKQRPAEKSLTVFMPDELWDKFLDLTDPERQLLDKMENRPLTLLVKPTKDLSHLAQDGRVGLRVIDHPMMARLALDAMVPLTATSANITGQPPCLTPDCIIKNFPGRDETTYDLSLGAILDGGELGTSAPSTIARLDGSNIEIVRPGSLAESDLQT